VGRRIRWLGIVMLLCFGLVVVQLVNIQFVKAKSLADSPYNPRVSKNVLDNQRGTIYAADGTVLAQSVKSTSTSPDSPHYMRVYPQGPLFAGITGFNDIFYGSPSGIEYQYNQYLQTHAQAPQNFSQLLFNKPPSEPDDVTLTVDPVLQQAAWNALQAIPGPNKDGAVVVLNPTTGAVLAMASNPTFDPNLLANPSVSAEQAAHFEDSLPDSERFFPLVPMATQERFPPGSSFKVVTSTAAYNLKPSLDNYSVPSLPYPLTFSDSNQTLSDDSGFPCGGTMAEMLPPSCDPGYGRLGELLGVPVLTQQAQLFGYAIYGTKNQFVPNIDIPNVIPSTFSNLALNSQALLAYSAIGQDNVSATALQNALVASGIANGGVIMTPHLMQQIRDSQGNVVTTYQPTPMLTAATQQAAASVNTLMQSVVTTPGATASGIGFPPQWQMAVKTGTAQVQAPNQPEQTDDWLIGFDNAKGAPNIAIAVIVPYQAVSATGAAVSGPIMKSVVQAYMNQTGAAG
jgi:peptidoglycan glycosyltransferase